MLDFATAIRALIRAADTPASNEGNVDDAVNHVARSILDEARRNPDGFNRSIRHGLSDAVRRLDRVSIAVTGLAWLGSGIPSVEQQMLSLVREAQREVRLCAYSITSGAMPLLREIDEVVSQGVTATVIVNAIREQPIDVRSYMTERARHVSGRWKVLDFAPVGNQTDLHAKLLTVDRSVALIGSANMSFRGMVSNHEMAVVVRGPTAATICERFDMLIRSAAIRALS
jgi:phosphatidylserine/phosphatidylglycerophosphate/cardiolipin synthase-like enzyme